MRGWVQLCLREPGASGAVNHRRLGARRERPVFLSGRLVARERGWRWPVEDGMCRSLSGNRLGVRLKGPCCGGKAAPQTRPLPKSALRAFQARLSRSVTRKRKREDSVAPTPSARSRSCSRTPRDVSGLRDAKVSNTTASAFGRSKAPGDGRGRRRRGACRVREPCAQGVVSHSSTRCSEPGPRSWGAWSAPGALLPSPRRAVQGSSPESHAGRVLDEALWVCSRSC